MYPFTQGLWELADDSVFFTCKFIVWDILWKSPESSEHISLKPGLLVMFYLHKWVGSSKSLVTVLKHWL